MSYKVKNLRHVLAGLPALAERRRVAVLTQKPDDSTRQRDTQRRELVSATQVLTALVLAIIAWQSVAVSESFARFWSSPLWIIPYVAWPAMFFLAGFQLADKSLPQAMGRVLVSVVGPLFLTVICTAFVLGPAVTIVPLRTYFRDGDVWSYLLNLIGLPQFTLPGVFEFHDLVGVVTGPVWAVPCLAMTFLVAQSIGWVGCQRWAIALGLSLAIVAAGLAAWVGWLDASDQLLGPALAASLAGQFGILAYDFRAHFKVGRVAVALSAAALAAISYLGRGGGRTGALELQIIAAIVCVPLMVVSRLRLPFHQASVALGPFLGALLLVAFPIQQLVASWPSSPQDAFGNLLLAFPLVAATSLLMVGLCAGLARMTLPTMFEQSVATNLPRWQITWPWAWARKRRKVLPPMLLLFTLLVAITLGVLAMTLFALQRNPWEN
jgi:hypothetical protein